MSIPDHATKHLACGDRLKRDDCGHPPCPGRAPGRIPARQRPSGRARAPGSDPADSGRGGAVRPADAYRGDPGAVRRARRVAGLGAARAGGGHEPGRDHRAVGAPGHRGRARPRRPERDHLDRHRVRQVRGLPAARAGRRAGRRDRALHRAHPGAGGRPAAPGQVAGGARRPARGGRRGHPVQRAHLGPGTRQLPADHAGHAAPHAAAAARQVERFPAPPAVRDRGRMPQLPRGVRLACGPGPAPPEAHRGLPPAGRPPLRPGAPGRWPEGPARGRCARAALLPLHRCSFWRRRR